MIETKANKVIWTSLGVAPEYRVVINSNDEFELQYKIKLDTGLWIRARDGYMMDGLEVAEIIAGGQYTNG